jgi:hypothetical protein
MPSRSSGAGLSLRLSELPFLERDQHERRREKSAGRLGGPLMSFAPARCDMMLMSALVGHVSWTPNADLRLIPTTRIGVQSRKWRLRSPVPLV